MDAYIHSDAGGGNEHTGLILSEGQAIITWLGRFGEHEIEVHSNTNGTDVWFRCNPDEKCWEALNVIMNQIYSNGGELVSLMRESLYSDRTDVYPIHDAEGYLKVSDWNNYGDIETCVYIGSDIISYHFR